MFESIWKLHIASNLYMLWSSEEILKPDDREEGEKKA